MACGFHIFIITSNIFYLTKKGQGHSNLSWEVKNKFGILSLVHIFSLLTALVTNKSYLISSTKFALNNGQYNNKQMLLIRINCQKFLFTHANAH